LVQHYLINAALSVGPGRSGGHRPESYTTPGSVGSAGRRRLSALSRIAGLQLEAGHCFERLLTRLLSGEFGEAWRRLHCCCCGGDRLEALITGSFGIADL
jgi:hypothetical protein